MEIYVQRSLTRLDARCIAQFLFSRKGEWGGSGQHFVVSSAISSPHPKNAATSSIDSSEHLKLVSSGMCQYRRLGFAPIAMHGFCHRQRVAHKVLSTSNATACVTHEIRIDLTTRRYKYHEITGQGGERPATKLLHESDKRRHGWGVTMVQETSHSAQLTSVDCQIAKTSDDGSSATSPVQQRGVGCQLRRG